MAEIKVECYIRHCTDTTIQRQNNEWIAYKAVKLVKGETINGSFNFQVRGITSAVTTGNAAHFIREVCAQFGSRIRIKYGGGVTIVPVPNSDGLVSSSKGFRTYELAQHIAKIAGCEASDVLRWKSALGKAHKGEKLRDADAHRSALKVMRVIDRPIVLFDDVITSGSQMYGSKLMLEAAGMNVVGMFAVAEVLDRGERSDAPGWRTAVRNPFSMVDFLRLQQGLL
ncbi:hypothetical protein ELI07_15235 [Rhizobium leguminosarum]|uniref:hypothetical protein n=1 Tax=Rhizobium leguminosarum TaxID=384 RepID=UPI0010320685|nr:hypothetical protein [Rhizobium leguminosarum]TAX10758.1 hypothetical protein ELI07_15235 [Rhizobium leguminosarum]